MRYTEACVKCGNKEIACATGHVLKGEESIIACFCRVHKPNYHAGLTEVIASLLKGGYEGEWQPWMGECDEPSWSNSP